MSNYQIVTDKPVAFDSPDHLYPLGTAQDNSTNVRFNRKLFRYIRAEEVRLLDIGCSGGGFVRSILDSGAMGIGIEGSDYSKSHLRAEWAAIPDHLFTADATERFQIVEQLEDGRKNPLLFNVITAWEFFEHISEENLPSVVENILRHLARQGMLFVSISSDSSIIDGVDLHQTVQQKPWWIKSFARLGLERQPMVERYFNFDTVRGEPMGLSFSIVLTRQGDAPPELKRLRSLNIAETPVMIFKYTRWIMRYRSIYYLCWYAKRKIEFTLGGREFR